MFIAVFINQVFSRLAVQIKQEDYRMDNNSTLSVNETPGPLHGSAEISLQTGWAVGLLRGRAREKGAGEIIGLFRFASLLQPIWEAAKEDDPYADMYLVQIEDRIGACKDEILATRRALEKQINKFDGLKVDLPESTAPVTSKLHFSVPLAWQAAQLVYEFDRLILAYMMIQHLGLATGSTDSEKRQAGHLMRSLFSIPIQYHYMGITRADVQQGTAQAVEAKEKMGEIPADIMAGTRRCSLLAAA